MRYPLFLFLAGVVLFAAVQPAAAQKFQPKSIQFKGVPEYSEQEMLAVAALKKGAILTVAEMGEHSKRLMDTGVFETLSFKFDGQDLIYTLVPTTGLLPIRLENLPLMPGKDLDAKIHDRFPLYHGKVPSEGGLLEDVRGALEEILAAQGIKASVAAIPYTDRKLQKVTAISFTITAPPVQVGAIQLDGSSPSLDKKAQEILAKQSGSDYDHEGSPNQVETNLGNYYRDKGYLEATVHAAP